MDQLACLEVHVNNKNVVITLVVSLSRLYEHLIVVLETLLI